VRTSCILVNKCVKYFGAVRAVKTLDVAILRRPTGLNKLQLNLLLFSPELHVVARVFRAIIDAYAFGLTMEVNKVIQCSSHARERVGTDPDRIPSTDHRNRRSH
jgi:hypothetical protein